jgi:hypothetical protein
MHKTLWLGVIVVFCVGLTVFNGCGPSNPRGSLAVSGTVTFEGQPLDQGSIEFTSLPGETEARSGALIQNGSFSIPAHQGLPPGKYRVRVYSSEAVGMTGVPEAPGDSTKFEVTERIPAEWNTESEQEIEVTSGGRNEFDFVIQ